MNFSEELICLRKQKGLSQEQLGEEVGVTRQTVSKWELGETTPDMDKLIQLAKLFEISIDELVGKEAPAGQGTLCRMNNRPYYEYKSKRTFHGLPLVHVKIGPGITKAKGVVAVGTVATGIVTFGAISIGVLSFGALAFGLIDRCIFHRCVACGGLDRHRTPCVRRDSGRSSVGRRSFRRSVLFGWMCDG